MKDDNIGKALGLSSEISPEQTECVPEVITEDTPVTSSDNDDIQNDYTFSRQNLYNILTKGAAALEEMTEIAAQSQHPRAFESLALLIKNLGDVNDKLMQLHKDVKELEEEEPAELTRSIQVANAVFVGSTSELLNKVREQRIPKT